jgi:hypothetical protein
MISDLEWTLFVKKIASQTRQHERGGAADDNSSDTQSQDVDGVGIAQNI